MNSKKKGNTEHAAEFIQQKTGADLVEIEMENPYRGNIYEVSQADLNQNIRPALHTHVENMEQYDVILLGYRLLENEELPGWLCMPKQGATMVWENWEGPHAPDSNIASLNHYSKGAVCRWLFDTMCGIRAEGENHFTIIPRPGGRFTHARAAYASIYGKVESGWERSGDGIAYTLVIPANCTATVMLPGREAVELSAETYTFMG